MVYHTDGRPKLGPLHTNAAYQRCIPTLNIYIYIWQRPINSRSVRVPHYAWEKIATFRVVGHQEISNYIMFSKCVYVGLVMYVLVYVLVRDRVTLNIVPTWLVLN